MKKLIFSILLCLPLLVQAQTLTEVFTAMPDSLQALLTKNNRMDMVDFLASHMEARVTNRMDGQSVMDTLTTDYLHMTLTGNTVVEMKLLPRGEEKVVAVLHTAGAPVKDSVLQYFTTDWKETSDLTAWPDFSAFEAKPRSELTEEQIQLLEALADMQLTTMTLSPADCLLHLNLSTDILPEEDREKVQDLIKEVVVDLKK